MHILPSRGRPHLLQEYFDKGKPEQRGVVVLDTDQSGMYAGLVTPPGWRITYVNPMQGFVAKVNLAFSAFPDEPWYTLEGDDMIGRTPHWDTILAQQACAGWITWGNDLYFGKCTHPYIPGDYCRDLGWVAHPAFKHNYVDAVWERIATDLGIGRYMDQVITEARHYSNHKIPYDQTARERMEKNDGVEWVGFQCDAREYHENLRKITLRHESYCR